MGIAGDKPRQLAPSVGTTGSGSTDSPAPSSTTSKTGIYTIVGIAAPTNVDTIVGIAAPTNVDTTSKTGIDTIVGIAAPTSIDTTSKIGIDTIVGIAVPATAIDNPMEPEVDAVNSTIVNSASPSAINLTPTANLVDPALGTAGIASEGYDMAFGLFNFHVDSCGAMKLLSIAESAPLVAETAKLPTVGGKPSTNASPASAEERPKPETSTPSVGSNDFEDPPPSPTTAYCVDCDAYHYVGAGDFFSHEIAGCEDPRGGTAAVYPTISEFQEYSVEQVHEIDDHYPLDLE
jgi:hypothetical protein